jgi:hypothetical protein
MDGCHSFIHSDTLHTPGAGVAGMVPGLPLPTGRLHAFSRAGACETYGMNWNQRVSFSSLLVVSRAFDLFFFLFALCTILRAMAKHLEWLWVSEFFNSVGRIQGSLY